jgi:hypothetical protein
MIPRLYVILKQLILLYAITSSTKLAFLINKLASHVYILHNANLIIVGKVHANQHIIKEVQLLKMLVLIVQ